MGFHAKFRPADEGDGLSFGVGGSSGLGVSGLGGAEFQCGQARDGHAGPLQESAAIEIAEFQWAGCKCVFHGMTFDF
jgi:hypothetical protein